MRPCALTGIEDVVSRSDLADRTLFVTLQPIPEERRRPESELEEEFIAARPAILGALLDAVSHRTADAAGNPFGPLTTHGGFRAVGDGV